MGWSFDNNTRGLTLTQLKQYLVNDLSQRDERFTLLDHGGAGEELYALLLNKETQEKVIQLTLMRNFDGEWGLKDIGDSSHPYYFNCPVRLLDQATTQDKDAVKWRQACYQQHNENKARKDFAANLQAGDLVATEDGGFSGQYVRKYNKTGSRIVCLGENNTQYQVRVSNVSVEKSNQLRETSAWAQANLTQGDTILLLESTGYGQSTPLTLDSINPDGLTAVCINADGEDDVIAWRDVDKAATEQHLNVEQVEPSSLPQRAHIEQAYLLILREVEEELNDIASIPVHEGLEVWIEEVASSHIENDVDSLSVHDVENQINYPIETLKWDEGIGNWHGKTEPHSLDFESLKETVRQRVLDQQKGGELIKAASSQKP